MDRPEEIQATQQKPKLNALQAWAIEHQDVLTRVVPLTVVVIFVTIGAVLWLTDSFEVDEVGYAGVWVFSFIGAASIFVPVPGLAAVCVAASPAVGLNPLLIGVIAGSAEALGELTGYLAGLGGRNVCPIDSDRRRPERDRSPPCPLCRTDAGRYSQGS